MSWRMVLGRRSFQLRCRFKNRSLMLLRSKELEYRILDMVKVESNTSNGNEY
jgi:hypothetical protein